MKKILISLVVVLAGFSAQAEDFGSTLLEQASGKFSEFTAGLIPGEGHTEVSIDLREEVSPDFSILAVREIAPRDDGNIFTQFSLHNTEAQTGDGGDERFIGNLGLGTRKLLNDNTLMIGINNFYDYDLQNEHTRASLGLEARSAVLEFYLNRYAKLSDDYNAENVLDGWDYSLSSQIPYLHWATAFISGYEWEGVTRGDIEGTKIGSELVLTPNLNFEVAYDDKKGNDNEWYSKFQFIHPGKEGPTLLDGASNMPWKENRDMSSELLSKVKRHNKIMIEFKGAATISRTD